MYLHVKFGKIHAVIRVFSELYFRVWQCFTSEFGIYKSPILLEFSSNGGLAPGGWGLFSTKSLILVNIFHNSCRKSLLYLRQECQVYYTKNWTSTPPVPTKYGGYQGLTQGQKVLEVCHKSLLNL